MIVSYESFVCKIPAVLENSAVSAKRQFLVPTGDSWYFDDLAHLRSF